MTAVPDGTLARALHEYLAAHRDQMLALLEALVRAESPTDVPEAQANVQAALTRLLEALGFRVQFLLGAAVLVAFGAVATAHYLSVRRRRTDLPANLVERN
mgnify:CR=1 FL=1